MPGVRQDGMFANARAGIPVRAIDPWTARMHPHRALRIEENRQAFNHSPAEKDFMPILEALRTLSREHRAVIVETFYHRLSVVRAAEILGISPDVVKSRCFDALQALKHALAEQKPPA